MNKIIIGIILCLPWFFAGYAQCGDETYELAVAQAGKDIVLVRDFRVKLNEGNKRNQTPSSRFNILMQKGLTYRFIISKDKNSDVQPVLQLFDRNNLLGSTFNIQSLQAMDKFEYLCTRTGNYQVFVSIRDSKAGCAVGIMSMVIDSAFYAQGNKIPENDKYTLYAGIKNPLHIYTDQKQVKRTEVTSSIGSIIVKDSLYYAFIPTVGTVSIKVKLFNFNDTVIEELEQVFKVIPLPKPVIKIEGVETEYLSTFNIGHVLKLSVVPSIYKIQEFYLSDESAYNSGYRSDNEYFTYEMIDFIKTLEPNKKIYLKEIKVVKPDGSVEHYGPITYFIR
jgi:hypothetical protein